MGDHQGTQSIGKRIGEFLILGIYLAIDVSEFWHKYHFWSLVAALIGIVALLLLDGGVSRKHIASSATVAVLACIGIYFIVPPVLPDETDIHGWLLPAREATPVNACGGEPRPKDAILFVFGTNGAWTIGNEKLNVLEVGNCVLMSMQREGMQLAFDTDVFDTSGELIARIEKNEFQLVPGKFSYQRRSEDRSDMTVYDKHGDLLLSIRYLNAGVVKVNGTFVCSDMTKVVVTDDAATLPERRITASNNCKGGFSGKTAGFKFTQNGIAF
jgi:hypothetical protein